MTKPYITVIGAVNMDICGTPFAPLLERDSNPGTVRVTPGGVGFNIAHNLCLMGADVRFVTALGDDVLAEKVEVTCAGLGMDLSDAVFIPGGATSSYLFITDPSGDMRLAVADTDISGCITPEYLRAKLPLLCASKLVVFDGNLTAETIAWLADNCTAPMFADPVSAAKAVKIKEPVGRLHTIKPNVLEAGVLSGVKITDRRSLERAAGALLDKGTGRVFVTLGENGVLLAEGGDATYVPCVEARMLNTSGCGDAALAALALAFVRDLSSAEAAKLAMAASSFAIECAGTVNPELSADALFARAFG